MAKIRVRVTQQDIEKANERLKNATNHCLQCPISQALKRTLGVRSVHTGEVEAQIGKHWIPLPRIAGQFLATYDKDKSKAKPFSFVISCDWLRPKKGRRENR